MGRFFVGLEISTQQVKIIAVNNDLAVVYQDGVKFDSELPEFNTSGGVHMHDDNMTFTAPTLMWVKAIDMILMRMKNDQFDFSKVAAVSGTGQQHGSVYWRSGAEQVLMSLDSTQSMAEQLAGCFSIDDSPIWMDTGTGQQCRNLEQKLGGALKVCEITGCRAFHRITGNQIAKIYQTKSQAYSDTEHISLVSSFGASLMLGTYAPIDESDGSGMNLMDLKTRKWSSACLQAHGVDGLEAKLGKIVPSSQCVGFIAKYLVDRYGFAPDCRVIAFTGDNPASMAGIQVQPGDIVMSLGTSDTVLMWLEQPKVSIDGAVLVNPLDTNSYMGLLCFKNGSLTREHVRNLCSNASWEDFCIMLDSTPRGNNGNIGFYFDVPEITPNAVGIFRFNSNNDMVDSFSPEIEVRAVIEGQFLSRRVYAENLGCSLGNTGRVLATGGASKNVKLLQVLSDVFNTPVYVQNVADSACLGSAYRAKHGYVGGTTPFQDVISKETTELFCAARPSPDASQVYDPLIERYRMLERRVVPCDHQLH